MALTKRFLKAMGLEDAQIEQIFEAHEESINSLRAVRDELQNKVNTAEAEVQRLASVEKDLLKANVRLEEFEKTTKDLADLRKEYDTYKADISAKATADAKRKAYKSLLEKAGIPEKRHDAIIRVTDLDDVSIGEDGKLENAKELEKTITSEWSDFVVKETVQGANTANPPANVGGSTFEKMSLAEKMSYANENPDNAEVKAWIGN